jgi:hypothetical protein
MPGSTSPQAAAPAQQPAVGSHASLAAARQDLAALLGDLAGVCGQLEELATTLRREHASGTPRQLPLAFPHRLQSAARQLAATLQALVEAGPGPDPDQASSAAVPLAALRGEVAAAVSDRRGHHGDSKPGHDPGPAILTGIEHALNRVMTRQQSLIAHLADSAEAPARRMPAASRWWPLVSLCVDLGQGALCWRGQAAGRPGHEAMADQAADPG